MIVQLGGAKVGPHTIVIGPAPLDMAKGGANDTLFSFAFSEIISKTASEFFCSCTAANGTSKGIESDSLFLLVPPLSTADFASKFSEPRTKGIATGYK